VGVLRQADLLLTQKQDHRLSRWLGKQQAGTLTEPERIEALAPTRAYEAPWLR
jgi:hypothetical protein